MWLLKKIKEGTTKYLISDQKSYTFGRKNCDIILPDDSSVSRKHCTIHIAKRSDCPFNINTLTGVWVVDEESKYGTYLKSNTDWIKITPKQNKALTNGSIIKIGLMENVWSLEYKPLIGCPSGIPTEQKKKIENTLKAVDGELRNVWSKECSFVIVNVITLTVKVVLALINGVPIITPNYIEKLVESIKSQTPFPNYEDFRPDIKESILNASLVSLDINNTRKELFKGKKFVIPTKRQLETLKEVILSAGGEIELFTNNGNQKRYADENVIMIQMPLTTTGIPEELQKSFQKVSSFLKNEHGKRIVPESEIAQAVAYSSTEKYCNPNSTCFNLTRIIKEPDLGVVLVEETPDVAEMSNVPDYHVIPCSSTGDSQMDKDLGKFGFQIQTFERKRVHSPDPIDFESPVKKSKSKSDSPERGKGLSLNLPASSDDKSCDKNKTQPSLNKKSTLATSLITNYFQKESQQKVEQVPAKEKVPEPEIDDDFWNVPEVLSVAPKRKLSSEISESSNKKRIKFPSEDIQEKEIQTIKVTGTGENSKNPAPVPTPRTVIHDPDDDNLVGFIEKEKPKSSNSALEDLNNTIISLTLISLNYRNKDGSLIDPPTIPLNVKKFKKQNVNSSMIATPEERIEDDLSDDDWIEPHPVRLGVSVKGDDW